ncbi:DUF2334 domain-containing protein [Paenibacillus sp. KN14-4R]|uniref:DUF2334 domain-containing protein n=1 Tax=Paenibacillus sp. KN14-4R TaxID=3445773 RepID=UPI003FA0030B
MLNKSLPIKVIILLSIFMAMIGPVNQAHAAVKQCLIVYNDIKQESIARAIWDLTGHFNVNARIVSQTQITAKALEGIDYVIAVSEHGKTDFTALRPMLKDRPIQVMWVGGESGEAGLHKRTIIDVTYRGIKYPMRNHVILDIPAPKSTDVKITASDGSQSYTLGYMSDQEWGFASIQLLDNIGLVFADWLHDFFGEPHSNKHEAFLRIEDVSPITDPSKLKEITDFLAERQIPFMIATIPVYVNPDTGKKISLQDRPEIVDALKYAVANGGSIVMHGFTHQYYQSETGEGFEFWDAEKDQPIPNEESYTTEKLERGIAQLMQVGLYPLAFEPPHYAMSQLGYQIAHRYFSTMIASVQLTDNTYKISHAVPYRSRYQSSGMAIIPETLGYVLDEPGHIPLMITHLEELLLVRDSALGAFYHTTLPIELLKELVDGLQKHKPAFIDLKNEHHQVHTDYATINSNDGQIIPMITNQEKFDAAVGKNITRSEPKWISNFSFFFTWGIAVVVGLFILLFLIFMILLKKRKKYRLFQEEDSSNDR